MTPFERNLIALIPHLKEKALRLTSDPTKVDDLVQDTLCRALATSQTFTSTMRLTPWVNGIMRERFADMFKEAARENTAQLSSTPSSTLPPNQESAFMFMEVMGAVRQLSAKYREVLHLCALEGWDTKSTSEWLQCSKFTVYKRLADGRQSLTDFIDGKAAWSPEAKALAKKKRSSLTIEQRCAAAAKERLRVARRRSGKGLLAQQQG